MRKIATLLFLFISGPLLAEGAHKHAQDHAHELREVPAGSISLHAEPDPVGGWNVEVRTQDFRFVPEKVNGPHVDGEGHGHIYIDGEKRRRIYGSWFHIDPLGPGRHELKVSLNGHSHERLVVDGEPLEARTVLEGE